MTSSSPSAAISIRVLLFASYAELLGSDAVILRLDTSATVADVIARLRALPGGDRLPPRPLCAVNLAQSSEATVLKAGDEVAILPPLAGG